MSMSVQNAAKITIQQLEKIVAEEKGWNPKIYIGKTNNDKRREEEHLAETHPVIHLVVVAKGPAKKITELEKLSVEAISNSRKLRILNERGGGGGNPDATMLYVAFSEPLPDDDLFEEDAIDKFPQEILPISL